MSRKDVAADVCTALAAAGLGTFSATGSIKKGPKGSPTTPGNDAVDYWVTVTGGRGSEPLINAVAAGSMRHASVQVLAQSDLATPDDPDSSRTRAQQAFEALHTKAVTTSGAPYISCMAMQSEPLPLGVEPDSNRWEHSINFELSWIDTN